VWFLVMTWQLWVSIATSRDGAVPALMPADEAA
jgi:hypothetical protein